MARKNVLAPVLVSSAQSLAASFTSPATIVDFLDNVAYQINVTTTNSTGTFSVQASLDYVPANNANTLGQYNAGTWCDLTLSGTPAVSAANDVIMIDLNQLPFRAVRISYTAGTAGTGTCNIRIMSKELGG